MKKYIHYIIFITFLFSLVSCNPQKTEWKGTIEEKDGVIIVKNPKEPMYGEEVFSIEEELTIGDNEKVDDYSFEVIVTIRADDNGNIYVLDGKAQQVKVFDKSGKYLRNIGRKGQGPGEYSLPTGLHVISKKEIMVSSITRRLSFFSFRGNYLRQITGSPSPFPIPDSKANFIIKTMTMSAEGNRVTELNKYNPNFELIFSYGKIEKESPLARKKQNPFSIMLHFTVLGDDSVVWGINNQYQLKIVNSGGRLTKKITKSYDPIKVTKEYKQNYLKSNETLARSLGIIYKFPEYYPPIQSIRSDDEARIFVWSYEKDEENNNFYDVFDSEGRYLAKITLKNKPVYWKKEKLYTIEENNEGFQVVKRYKVTWNY